MRLAIALVVLLVARTASAHDFFLSASSHRIAPGEPVAIVMRVGSELEVDEIPRSNRRVVVFDAHHGSAVRPVPGNHGESPAGTITFDAPGVATIVFQSSHTDTELPADKFEAYLKEEGLDEISAERARLGVTGTPGNESYARYAKLLVSVGDAQAGWDRRVGLPAELVALTDPRAGGRAQFQLFYEGAPRANALVDLLRIEKTRVTSVAHARTDADGKVTLAIPSDGVWVAATTLMRLAPAELQLEGDWQSYWVSLAFETGGAFRPATKRSGSCSVTDPSFALVALLAFLRRRR